MCRICMLSCCLLCPHHQEWVEVLLHHHKCQCQCQWVGWGWGVWGCLQCHLLECHQWATNLWAAAWRSTLRNLLQLLHSRELEISSSHFDFFSYWRLMLRFLLLCSQFIFSTFFPPSSNILWVTEANFHLAVVGWVEPSVCFSDLGGCFVACRPHV